MKKYSFFWIIPFLLGYALEIEAQLASTRAAISRVTPSRVTLRSTTPRRLKPAVKAVRQITRKKPLPLKRATTTRRIITQKPLTNSKVRAAQAIKIVAPIARIKAAQDHSDKGALPLKELAVVEERDSTPDRKTHLVEKKSLLLLTTAINNLVAQANKKASVGIKILFLSNNKCLYQKNPDQVFTPASNTKMITAGAAFHILGPSFTFETQLLTDQQLSAGRVQNLYIRGGGDPTLLPKDLEKLVLTLKGRSIKEVRGNLIIDASLFDTQTEGPGWKSKGDGPIFDKSPVGALMISHSCITVRVKPSPRLGQKPTVQLDPENSLVRIDNRAHTVAHSKKHALHVTRAADNTVIVTGTIAKASKQKFYRIAIAQPHLYAGSVLMTLLRKHKILCKGRIIVGTTPQDAKLLACHISEPLTDIIRHMMKSSDNLYADALFKKMGAVTGGTPGTWANGKKAVEGFLTDEVGLSLHHLIINDGSGLSHANKISPDDLAHFLSWIYKHAPFKELFIESLPISGIDGTLKGRMTHKTTHSKIKAKTGSLFGVSSLSGYITPKNGEPLVFVIMVNRKNKSTVEFKRKLEDHLCTLLAAHAFSTS